MLQKRSSAMDCYYLALDEKDDPLDHTGLPMYQADFICPAGHTKTLSVCDGCYQVFTRLWIDAPRLCGECGGTMSVVTERPLTQEEGMGANVEVTVTTVSAMAVCPYCLKPIAVLISIAKDPDHGLVVTEPRAVIDRHLDLEPDCPLAAFAPDA